MADDRRYGLIGNKGIKVPCKVATTANVVLNGLQTIDGVVLASGDRVLINNQTSSIDNGIYIADTGAWIRSVDANDQYDLVEGSLIKVNYGTVGIGFWYVSSTGTIIPGTSALTFTQASTVLAVINVYMQTFLAAASAAAARVVLGVGAAGDSVFTAITAAAARAAISAIASGDVFVAGNGSTGSTQASGDNSTKLATDAYADRATRVNLSGLTMSTAGASATMSVAAGQCNDSTNASSMTVAATSKTTSAWVLGAAVGGLDTGAIANTTWYHFYAIRRPDTGVVDLAFSLSANAPTFGANIPAAYTQYRRIGAGLTNGSAQWVKFSQLGDEFIWDAAVIDVDATNPGTAAVTRTLTVPTGVQVIANVVAGSYMNTVNINTVSITALDVSDQTQQAVATAALTGFGSMLINGGSALGRWAMVQMHVRTNTSAQVRSKIQISGATDHLGIITVGWFDSRGKVS